MLENDFIREIIKKKLHVFKHVCSSFRIATPNVTKCLEFVTTLIGEKLVLFISLCGLRFILGFLQIGT